MTLGTVEVRMDRVGRTHEFSPFRVEARDLNDLAEQIYTRVRPHLASREVEVSTDAFGGVQIFAGMNNGGSGTWAAVASDHEGASA